MHAGGVPERVRGNTSLSKGSASFFGFAEREPEAKCDAFPGKRQSLAIGEEPLIRSELVGLTPLP